MDLIGIGAMLVCTTGGTGFLPMLFNKQGKWGGTIGSVVGFLALVGLAQVEWFTTPVLCFATFMGTIIGTTAIFYGEPYMFERWGKRRRHTGSVVMSDFNETNIDEVVGMFVGAMLIWPWRDLPYFWVALLVLLGLFRWIDIKKPGPVAWAEERFTEQWEPISIMLDDVVGGAIVGAVLCPVVWLFH